MRRPRLVLCVDEDATVLGLRAFVLEVWGYRVLRARGAAEALALLAGLKQEELDLVAARVPLQGFDEVLKAVRGLQPEAKTLAVSDGYGDATGGSHADVWLPRGTSRMELRERMRILMVRKRGPRPMPVGAVRAIAAAEAQRA